MATLGVLVRPFRWPEAVWACGGAVTLVLSGLLPVAAAGQAVGKGLDVYLFLTGMMLLSETARREGLFDQVAALAVTLSGHSPRRLFLLIFAAGAVVTTFLSNDATAVVLTPAVYAAARTARVEPLPYLFICAFVANAASFVLPISNPANLVLYADHTPPLWPWLASFAVPSALSIVATFAILRLVEGARLGPRFEADPPRPRLTAGGWTALTGIALTALALLVVSALDQPLGLPTALLGVATTALVLGRKREAPWNTLRAVSWSVLPLVAGLFVLVQAVEQTGITSALGAALTAMTRGSLAGTSALAGGAVALVANLINNLPAGLIASATLAQNHPPKTVVDAMLIGVDLGPNLSITGSLATILWLTAIRREGESVGFWRFLRVGILVAPPALILAIGARLLLP